MRNLKLFLANWLAKDVFDEQQQLIYRQRVIIDDFVRAAFYYGGEVYPSTSLYRKAFENAQDTPSMTGIKP